MRSVNITVGIMLVIAFPISLAFADGWFFEVPYAFTQDGGMSLALGSGNNPHISFCEYFDGCLLYATKTDSTWDIYNIDDGLHPYYAGRYNDIAVDEEDNPHISYKLYNEAGSHLKYKYYNGSSWYSKIVDYGGNVDSYTSIDVDDENNPHISYYDESNGDLKYAYSNGSTWEITTVDYIGDVGEFTSIALDDENKPHIAYYDESNSDLKYAYWNGSTWEITVVYYIGNYGSDISLALDDDNNPHISYFDRSNSDLKYSYWNGFNWETSTVDNTSGTYSYSNSLALDDGNKPHISYESCDDYEYCLKYARWTGSSWDITEVDTTEYDDPNLDISMAIDSYNNPHISYCMWAGHYLKYAWYDPYLEIKLTSFSASPKGDSAIVLTWSVETTEGEDIIGFNLYRRPLTTEGDPAFGGGSLTPGKEETWTQINPTLITGQNPYTYTDSDVESGVAYEYKLEAVLDSSAETLGTTQATAGLPPASFAILALYPNPASEVLTCLFAVPGAGVVELALYDLSGRLVIERRIEATEPSEMEVSLDISGLASGVYTLRASMGDVEVSPASAGWRWW